MSTSSEIENNTAEIHIADLRILPEERYLGAIVDVVSDLAEANGINKKDADHLDKVLIEIFHNIVKYGFENNSSKPIEISILKRLNSFVISLKDKGLPFDYENLEQGEDKRFKSYLSKGYADEVNFYCLGTLGNETEILKKLPTRDIREEMDISEHHEYLKQEPAKTDEEILIQSFKHDKVHELVRLIYKCYGYTYANEFMYYPEEIEVRLHTNIMSSCGAYNSNDELVGHLALIYSKPGAKVGESGEAVVDPRYRGHHIFPRMKTFMTEHAAANGVIGVYGEAVTVHPYSQKGSLELGSTETGFLLGYSPGTVSFQSISEDEKPRRQSIALMFTPILDSKHRTIYVPETYKDIIETIYSNIGYDREFIVENKETVFTKKKPGHVSVSIRTDHNQGIITVSEFGNNTLNEIRFHLNQLRLQRVDCIYVDLPLNKAGSGFKASKLRDLGFFFGYVIPEYSDSDVLRLQYLNNVEISKDDIKTASDFGQLLLDKIFDDRIEVTSNQVFP